MIRRPRIRQLRSWLACIDRFLIASEAFTRHSDIAHLAELGARLGQLEHATTATTRQCRWGAQTERRCTQPHRRRREQLQLDAAEVLLRVHAAIETAGVVTRDDASHWNAAELLRRNGFLAEAVEAFRGGPALRTSESAWLLEISPRYVAILADRGHIPVLDPADKTPIGRLRVRIARGVFLSAQAQDPEDNLRELACTPRAGR